MSRKYEPLSILLFIICVFIIYSGCKQNDFIKARQGVEYHIYQGSEGNKVKYKNALRILLKRYYDDSLIASPFDSIPRVVTVDSIRVQPGFVDALIRSKTGDSIITRILVDNLINQEEAPSYAKKGHYIKNSIKIIAIVDDSLMAYVYQLESDVKIHRVDSILKRTQRLKDDSIILKAIGDSKNIIKLPGGIYVQILHKGEGGDISSGKKITADYKSFTLDNKFIDGSFDSSNISVKPIIFTIGGMQIISGLEEGIKLLKKGGEGKIFLPSHLAFGHAGVEGKVKPDECVYYTVRIIDVK